MLKLVKYLWTEIRNLDRILDGIGDFGQTENEILDSMFVQSLSMIDCSHNYLTIYFLSTAKNINNCHSILNFHKGYTSRRINATNNSKTHTDIVKGYQFKYIHTTINKLCSFLTVVQLHKTIIATAKITLN